MALISIKKEEIINIDIEEEGDETADITINYLE